MRVDGHYTILAGGPVTVVATARASDDERVAAYARHDAHRVLRNLCRAAACGDRRDLIGIYRLLVRDEGSPVRNLPTELFVEPVLDGAARGRLLVVKGWPWLAGYAGRGSSASGTLSPPSSLAPAKTDQPARSVPPPAPANHTAGHLHLTSRTAATAPRNRARTTIGVGEKVRVAPAGATGVLSWAITGSSALRADPGSSVTLTAHGRAETATVMARDTCGCTARMTFHVIEPDGVRMERAPGTGIRHIHGTPSVGIRANAFITPDTVSFAGIEVSEGDCIGIVTGYFIGTPLDGVHHAGHGAGAWVRARAAVAGKGSDLDGNDTAQSGRCSFGLPYLAGSFDWPIPWSFRVGGDSAKMFAIVHQRFTIDAAGGMTVTKGGASGSARLNDPSSDY